MFNKRMIYLTLFSLVLLDLVLSVWGFFFPELWYSLFHSASYIDPQALLKRCAANWLAFFILQTIALIKWEKSAWWLMIVAGCRLGDSLTDISCLLFANKVTFYAIVAFLIAGIGNILVGIYLIKSYLLKTERIT